MPTWRDRSDTVMWLRWWRARISGYLHSRKAGRRRDRAQRRPTWPRIKDDTCPPRNWVISGHIPTCSKGGASQNVS